MPTPSLKQLLALHAEILARDKSRCVRCRAADKPVFVQQLFKTTEYPWDEDRTHFATLCRECDELGSDMQATMHLRAFMALFPGDVKQLRDVCQHLFRWSAEVSERGIYKLENSQTPLLQQIATQSIVIDAVRAVRETIEELHRQSSSRPLN